MEIFAKATPLTSTTIHRDTASPWISVLLILSMVLLVCSGCDDSKAPVASNTQAGATPVAGTTETEPVKSDPLANVLQLAKAGDIDAAIEQFVAKPPGNWLETTALEEFRISETEFARLGRSERTRLQQQFIDRAGETKDFVRIVMDRAREAKKRGDEETAQRYVDAVNRFGRQLRDSDTVVIFQQTGSALADWSLRD